MVAEVRRGATIEQAVTAFTREVASAAPTLEVASGNQLEAQHVEVRH